MELKSGRKEVVPSSATVDCRKVDGNSAKQSSCDSSDCRRRTETDVLDVSKSDSRGCVLRSGVKAGGGYHFTVGNQVTQLQPGSPVQRQSVDGLHKHLHRLLEEIQLPQHHTVPATPPNTHTHTDTQTFWNDQSAEEEEAGSPGGAFVQVESEAIQLSCRVLLTELHPQLS